MKIEIGDIVKGTKEASKLYGITTEKMTKAVVQEILGENIEIRILEHKEKKYGIYTVKAECFEVVGHIKPFNREEVLTLLKSGKKENIFEYDLHGADLHGADLRGANLRGADIDFSCIPLDCGGLHIKIDKRIACQIAYHLCAQECDDEEYIKMRNSILWFANQFHGVEECGKLEAL